MILDTLKQFNWVDIFVAVLFIRICYAAIKSGFLVELFKILGTIFAIYLSFHYFLSLSDFVSGHIPQNVIPQEFLNFLCFIVLAITGYLVFVILRQIILHFIKMEAIPKLSRWGGLILGIVRAFFFTGFVIFILVISTITYFGRSVAVSYSGKQLFKIAPAVYTGVWNGFASKFMPNEKFNQGILDIKLDDSVQ